MLEKFLKSENKIILGGSIEGNKSITNLTKMIAQTQNEREEAEKVKASNTIRIDELKQEIISFKNELQKFVGEKPTDDSEDQMKNQKLIFQLNKNIKRAEREKRKLDQDLENIYNLEEREKVFKSAIDELKTYITKDYLSKNENEIEDLVKKFYRLFKKSILTEFDVIAQENPDMGGAFDILEESRAKLNEIEKYNEKITKNNEDVTYDIYKMIKHIFTDNINLRKKVNGYIEAFLKQTENFRMKKY